MIHGLLKFAAAAVAGKVLYDTLSGEGDEEMQNCHDDVIAYHDAEVKLPYAERVEMRKRRNANRRRLRAGLESAGDPKPIGSHSQGSYAMRTMTQESDKDYDIDDGVYFRKADLDGPNGGTRSANDAKEMVRRALDDGSFKRPPEKRKNCVRVYYREGYHVDVPVYREVTETSLLWEEETWFELAGPEWRNSDPKSVTDWFREANKRLSLDANYGGQLCRTVRYLKDFARSRSSWSEQMPSGLIISKLVVEQYQGHGDREDWALRDTMTAIRDRLAEDLEVDHPTIDEKLTKGADDRRMRFFRDKLDWALDNLSCLDDPDCTRERALYAWDRIFSTSFFSDRCAQTQDEEKRAATSASVLHEGAEDAATRRPVDKRGEGRFA